MQKKGKKKGEKKEKTQAKKRTKPVKFGKSKTGNKTKWPGLSASNVAFFIQATRVNLNQQSVL